MAIEFYSSIDLNQNELQHPRLQQSGSNPTDPSPVSGQLYYNSGDNTVRFYDGSNWQTLSTTTGDITGVTAGTGLNGGGSSGAVTLNVDAAQTNITSVVNASLEIGRDADNRIKFGTDNQIIFEVDGGDNVIFKTSGEIEASSLDISGDIDVDGTANLDAVDIDGDVDLAGDLTFSAAKDILITDNSATALEIKEGSNLYMRFVTTNSSESILLQKDTTITGNLTVNGTTTTVNSTTVTVDDPIFTLGGDSAPGSDDNKDRGIEFRYHDGSAARIGFFGWDDSAGEFTGFTEATNSSEVFSGDVMNAKFGQIAGTLTTASQTNVTGVGTISTGVWQGTAIASAYLDADTAHLTTTQTFTGTKTFNDAKFSNSETDEAGGLFIMEAGDNGSSFVTLKTEDALANSNSSVTIPETGDGTFMALFDANPGSTSITATPEELNLVDGGTSRGTTAVADGDGFLHNDGGTMRMTNVSKLADLFAGTNISASSSVLSVADASASAKGVVELATAAEVITGTDTSRAVTPDTLAAKYVVCDIDVSSLTDSNIVTITHNLGTADILVQVYDKTTEANIMCDIARTTDDFSTASTSVVSIDFGTAPPNDCRALITSLAGATAGSIAYT